MEEKKVLERLQSQCARAEYCTSDLYRKALKARVRRLIEREGITEEYALARIAAQHPDAWFRESCALTLVNDGGRAEFAEKCRQCFLALMKEREA